jgi:hypothetical protein
MKLAAMSIISIALLASPLAAAPLGLGDAQAGAKPIELTFDVSPVPVPALRYQLTVGVAQQSPGNAAPIYMMGFALLPPDDQQYTQLSVLFDRPPAQFKVDEARQLLSKYRGAFEQFQIASQREQCWWEIPFREEGLRTQLPFLSSARRAITALAVQARLEIATKKYDDALRTIRTGFALGRHLQNDTVLVQSLVAAGIDAVMLDSLTELQEAQGAPNLYWSLASLPDPLIDRRAAFAVEQSWVLADFHELRERRIEQLSPDELRLLFSKMSDLQNAGNIQGVGGPANAGSASEQFEFVASMISGYGAARRYLISTGMTPQQVEQMPVQSVLAVYFVQTYQRWSDELYKWMNLPYWQAQEGLERAQEQMAADRSLNTNPLMVLTPAVTRATEQFAKLERRRAVLQTIEALRSYAAGHGGKLPPSLDHLTDTPAPADPMTGKPFDYRLDGDVATLHAAGMKTSPHNLEQTWHIRVR